jgi:hypothetical protein
MRRLRLLCDLVYIPALLRWRMSRKGTEESKGESMRWGKTIKFPIARSEDLLVQSLGEESVVYDDATKEAHCLKPLAAKVFEHSDGHTKVDAIAARVSEELGETVTVPQVQDAVAQLEAHGLMDHGPGSNDISRRELMRRSAKVGATAAVSAPLISSVFSAPAWAAGTSKTCGQLLCCTCFTGSGLNANDCCYIPHVTQNCECTNASGNSCKFCKPSGVGAPSDADCAAQYGCTPGVNCNPNINNGQPITGTVCAQFAAIGGQGACCRCGCGCGVADCGNPAPCCGQVDPTGTACPPPNSGTCQPVVVP